MSNQGFFDYLYILLHVVMNTEYKLAYRSNTQTTYLINVRKYSADKPPTL